MKKVQNTTNLTKTVQKAVASHNQDSPYVVLAIQVATALQKQFESSDGTLQASLIQQFLSILKKLEEENQQGVAAIENELRSILES